MTFTVLAAAFAIAGIGILCSFPAWTKLVGLILIVLAVPFMFLAFLLLDVEVRDTRDGNIFIKHVFVAYSTAADNFYGKLKEQIQYLAEEKELALIAQQAKTYQAG